MARPSDRQVVSADHVDQDVDRPVSETLRRCFLPLLPDGFQGATGLDELGQTGPEHPDVRYLILVHHVLGGGQQRHDRNQ